MELMYEIIGWIGAIAFATCAIPQAWDSYKKGHSRGITWGFFVLWCVGEIFTFLYVIPMGKWPMIFNYTLNMFFLGVIGYYKVKPRKRNKKHDKVKHSHLKVVK